MDIATIKRYIDEGQVEFVKIGAPDIEGVYRGKRVLANYFLDALEDGFAQCDVLFGWDIAENVLPNLKFSNWERGFADIVMKPDLSTFALVPWEENVASCICDLWSEHGDPVVISPRYVLNRVVERARSMGYEPMAAAELEFRFFRENQMSMREYGVEIEGYNREHGPGMYEMNIHYAPATAGADKTMLFKTGVKEICHQMGYTASFMAKWNDQEDGSSGHSHMSLWDRSSGQNVFWDESAEDHMSSTMRCFLAGVLDKLPELMALYAPVINSYKRYVEGTWAPLNTTWGMDNRTCGVRIINVNRGAMRIENRVPGADANFYLVFAATLASGLYGIERQLELPPRLDGNAYDQATIARAREVSHVRPLVRNLSAATDLLEQSDLAKEFLGADFVEHFVATRRWEVKEYEKAVTNWDRRRYLEL